MAGQRTKAPSDRAAENNRSQEFLRAETPGARGGSESETRHPADDVPRLHPIRCRDVDPPRDW
ncbi:hypothetical protein GCM10010492_06510 [Saccharothrix mutabilis subsp. mutabilis]|uniref:Uncharacterized protein n=1 Tax=Saccharothrix mutabilis subsp. mutabilis TaxID=66855 RepID=A0ABN0T3U7_9PSEU